MRDLLDRINLKLALPVALLVPVAGLALLTYDVFIAPTETVELKVAEHGEKTRNDTGGFDIQFTVSDAGGEVFEVDSNIYNFLEDGATYDCEAKGLTWLWLDRELQKCTLVRSAGQLPAPIQPPAQTPLECFGPAATSPVAPLMLQTTAGRCISEPGRRQAFLRCATEGQRGFFTVPARVRDCLKDALRSG